MLIQMQLQLGDELESKVAQLAVFGFFFLTAALMTASLLRNDAHAACSLAEVLDVLPNAIRPGFFDSSNCA